MTREYKLSILSKLIIVMLMSSSICQTVYTSLFMTKNLSLTIFVAVVPLTLLFFVMFRNKTTTIVSAIITIILIIAGLLYILLVAGIGLVQNWINNYSTWFIDVVNGFNSTSYTLFSNLTILLITFIITLFVYIFSIKIYNFYVITIMLFSVFFVQLYLSIFISNSSFILFIFSFLLYYFLDVLQRRDKETTYDVGNKLKYMLYVIPICIVVIGVSFIFPMKSNRLSISWLDNKFDSVIDNIVDYFNNKDINNFDYFSIRSTGFGSNDRLGGNIKLSKTHVMNVKSDYPNLYLKGSSKAFYNGHNWYESNEQLIPLGDKLTSYSNEINDDSNEFISGIIFETKNDKNDDIYKPARVEIEFTKIKTKSLFVPAKTNLLTFKYPMSLFSDNEQMLSTNEMNNGGFNYTLEYNSLMLGSEEFKSLLRKSYKGYYFNNFNNAGMNNALNTPDYKISIENNSKSEASNSIMYRGFIVKLESITKDTLYRRYTQLPDTITDRVRQLAQELAAGKNNTYDKAKAIETYLSTHYPYTLSPGNTPIKQDFVDYFLFDGKKGYCTYYATAMTVLLRCVDIPARYVEGYILPPENKNGVFKVTNQQAHAWVEVYFEGFGWIPFEPTSPFLANMYNDDEITPAINSDMVDSANMDYMEMIKKYGNRSSGSDYSEDINVSTEETQTNTSLSFIIIISSIIGILLLGLFLLAFLNIIKYYRIIKRIRKSDSKNSILIAYTYIIKVLKLIDIGYEAAETPSEFGLRVEKRLNFNDYSLSKTSFIKITKHYINARYSNSILEITDKQDMLDFIKILLKFTIERVGKFKFIILRCILGKI